jgi:hypothetical protein
MVGPSLPAEHKDKARRQAYVLFPSNLDLTNVQVQRHAPRRSGSYGSLCS